MRLTEWASDPLSSGPPPIPFTTDIVNSSNSAYRVGAIPPEALAEDLTARGLTYANGRGNGYRRNGDSIDAYRVGDVIADVFTDAAECLGYFLATSEPMLSVKAAMDELHRTPLRDNWEVAYSRRSQLSERVSSLERSLPVSYATLDLARDSLARTARSIRGIRYVREEAVRRFREVLPSPPRTRPASRSEIVAFLMALPPGPILRPALHAEAVDAGLVVGARTLYAAADALGWRLTRRKGLAYYCVPEAP